MEYYAFTDNETCADFFHAAMEELDEEHLTKSLSIKVSTNNYHYYAFNADGDLHVIVRTKNAVNAYFLSVCGFFSPISLSLDTNRNIVFITRLLSSPTLESRQLFCEFKCYAFEI